MPCNDTWQPAEGPELALHDMGDRHLRNALALVERNLEGAHGYYPNGEEAAFYLEQEIAKWEGRADALRGEVERRAATAMQPREMPDIPEYEAMIRRKAE